MPPLKDPEIRAKILDALSSSEHGDGVRWTRTALDSLQRDLPNITPARVNQILCLWVKKGKRIIVCEETRPEWIAEFTHHYDFKIKIGDKERYIECRLIDDAPSHPELFVVSFHDP